VQNLEASITLCDPLNPGFGYQIRITRAAPPGTPVDVLFTACNPATGESLLTYEQCLDVLAMYRSAPSGSTARSGFILRTENSKHHFFSSYIRGETQYVEAGNHESHRVGGLAVHREPGASLLSKRARTSRSSPTRTTHCNNQPVRGNCR